MVAFRRYRPLSLALLLTLQVFGAVDAAGEAGLYDQPVLTLAPGMHIAKITRADVAATGAYAVSGSEDKTVRIWAVETGQLLRTIRLPQGWGPVGRVYAIAISPDGALVDGEFYLLPYDVDAGDPVAIKATALSASTLRQELEGLARYGRVLVLLDACRSGGAMADGRALAVDATRLRAALVGPNVTVLTSSSAAQLSREDPRWHNGAFTKIFLEALSNRADANRNGLISVSELTGYLTRNVAALTDGAQQPGVEVRFDGDVFVAGL